MDEKKRHSIAHMTSVACEQLRQAIADVLDYYGDVRITTSREVGEVDHSAGCRHFRPTKGIKILVEPVGPPKKMPRQ